jgi:hypothetical protein
MSYPGFTKEGGVDISAYLVGNWSEVLAEVSSVDYYLGNVPEGVLEVTREYYQHEDVSFPRKIDLVVPVRTGMKFTGMVEEIHSQNVSFLLGETLAVAGQNYIYVGALATSYFFTFRGRRVRISDGVGIEFCIWKALVSSIFTLGSGDEAQGAPLEVIGLDDTDGDYGGSATSPIGFIHVPVKA